MCRALAITRCEGGRLPGVAGQPGAAFAIAHEPVRQIVRPAEGELTLLI